VDVVYQGVLQCDECCEAAASFDFGGGARFGSLADALLSPKSMPIRYNGHWWDQQQVRVREVDPRGAGASQRG
jgi:hypothetical protein